jgi:hypothetical protein
MGVHARSWKVPEDFRYQAITITASSHKTTTNNQDMVGFFRAHTIEAVVVLGAVPRCKSAQRTRLPRVKGARSRLFSARGEIVCQTVSHSAGLPRWRCRLQMWVGQSPISVQSFPPKQSNREAEQAA